MNATNYRMILIVLGIIYWNVVLVTLFLLVFADIDKIDLSEWAANLFLFTIIHFVLTSYLFRRYRRAVLSETDDLSVFGMSQRYIPTPEKTNEEIEESPDDEMTGIEPIPVEDITPLDGMTGLSSKEMMEAMMVAPIIEDDTTEENHRHGFSHR